VSTYGIPDIFSQMLSGGCVTAIRSNTTTTSFYSPGANRWFQFCFKTNSDVNDNSGTWDSDTQGWYLISTRTPEIQDSWEECLIYGVSDVNSGLERKVSFMASQGLRPSLDHALGSIFEHFNVHGDSLLDTWEVDPTGHTPVYVTPNDYNGWNAFAHPVQYHHLIDPEWNEVSLTLHIAHWNPIYIAYSKWSYNIQENSFTQMKPNNFGIDGAATNAFYNLGISNQDSDLIESLADLQTAGAAVGNLLNVHNTIPNHPWHQWVASNNFNYQYGLANPLFPNMIYWDGSDWTGSADHIMGMVHNRYSWVKLFVINQQAKIAYNDAWMEDHTDSDFSRMHHGRAWMFQEPDGSWTPPPYTWYAELEAAHSGENNDFTDGGRRSRDFVSCEVPAMIPSMNPNADMLLNVYADHGSNPSEKYFYWNKTALNVDIGSNFEPSFNDSPMEEAFSYPVEYKGGFGGELQIIPDRDNSRRIAFYFGNLWDINREKMHYIVNWAVLDNNFDPSWKVQNIEVDPVIGFITNSIDFTNGDPSSLPLQPWTKMVVNSWAGTINFLYMRDGGLVYKKKLALKDIPSLGESTNLNEIIGPEEYLFSALNQLPGTTLAWFQSQDLTSGMTGRHLLTGETTDSNSLIVHAFDVDFVPGFGDIVDFNIKELRTNLIIVDFSIHQDDIEHIKSFRFKKSETEILSADFDDGLDGYDEVLIENLDYKEDGELRRYEYKYTGLQTGVSYFARCKPILLSELASTNMSNQIQILLPERSKSVSSLQHTVPMNDANGALYVGTGPDILDKPLFIGRLTHTQFGTNLNSIVIDDSECKSPSGEASITTFTNMVPLNGNLNGQLSSYILGYVTGATTLFLIHKDSGTTLKTNQLGITVECACNCLTISGGVWVFEKASSEVHLITIDPGNINTTSITHSYPVNYEPKWAKYGNVDDNYTDRANMIGDTDLVPDLGSPGDYRTDLYGSDDSTLSIANIVEVGSASDAQLYLLADTSSMEYTAVPAGFTCIIRANTSESALGAPLLEWEDAMLPWNPSIQESEYIGQAYTREEWDGTCPENGIKVEYIGKIWDDETNAFIDNPAGTAIDRPIDSPTSNRPYEICVFSRNHGPHRDAGSRGGMTPIKNTMSIVSNSDKTIGFYAYIEDTYYRHLVTNEWIRNTGSFSFDHIFNCYDAYPDVNSYQNDQATSISGLVYVVIGPSSPGWANYFSWDSNNNLIENEFNGIKEDNYRYSNGDFECLHNTDGQIHKSEYLPSDIGLINNSTRTLSGSVGIGTNILSVKESDSTNTNLIAEEIIDYSKTPWTTGPYANLGNTGYTMFSPMRLANIASTSSPSTGDYIYGRIEIEFSASAHTFWFEGGTNPAMSGYETDTILTKTTISGTYSGPASDKAFSVFCSPLRNTAFHVTGIKTPFLRGDTNLHNKFTIRFWSPKNFDDVDTVANHDTSTTLDAAHCELYEGTYSFADGEMYDYNANAATTTALLPSDSGDLPDPRIAEGQKMNSYWGQAGLTSGDIQFTNTLMVNRHHRVDDSAGTAGVLGAPTGEQVVNTIVKAYDNAKAGGRAHPFITLKAKGTVDATDKRTLVIGFTYPQDENVLCEYDHTGPNATEEKNVGGSIARSVIPQTTDDHAAEGLGPATAEISQYITSTINESPESYKSVNTAVYKDAIVAASSNDDGSTYVDGGMESSSDEEYRLMSRTGTITFGKLLTKQNHQQASAWGSGAEKMAYQSYSLDIGSTLITAPGSLIIVGHQLGTYHEGRCVGWSDKDNQEDACVVGDDDHPNTSFVRTGSAKFEPKKKYFYRLSFTYDGYQESPLGATVWTHDMNLITDTAAQSSGYDSLKITLKLRDVSKRVTHVTLWRKDDTEEALYRSVQQVSLATGWINTGESRMKTITDDGREGPSYEALTGLSSTMLSSSLHYSLATVSNNMMFVGKSTIKETGEHYPNMLFRSQPGNFSIFNWINDYCKLPNIPNAIASMNNVLYAWDDSRMFIIDPLQMYVRETYEGIGCLGKESVIVSETGMFWFDTTNVYLLPRTGGIDYVGNKILTSEHGIGWQEISPDVPFQAIFDSKRKAFGMMQLYRPTQFFTNEQLENEEVSRSGQNSLDILNILNKKLSMKLNTQFPKAKEEALSTYIYNNKQLSLIRRLESSILSSKSPKRIKEGRLNNWLSQNNRLIKELGTFFTYNLPPKLIILATIVILKQSIRNRTYGTQ
tara:strand:- start:14384 stop:20998 length:6615 start_codon:yes stop_codon:yes gene_type:complete